jgi:hypothetical protein
MFKKALLILSLATTLGVVGAKADTETRYVPRTGEPYAVSTSTEELGDGRYKHYFHVELFNSSNDDIYLSHIRCNGDGNGYLKITDSNGDGVYSIDYREDADWSWDVSS